MSDLVGNPDDWFSRVTAHMMCSRVFQSTTKSVKVGSSTKKCELSLQVAVEMPSDIRRIYSPTHAVNYKVRVFAMCVCFCLLVRSED